MKRMKGALAGAALLWLVAAGPAAAATRGTTAVGPAVAGMHADVTASITSETPIAPYEFSIENRCWFSGRFNGHFDSYERFDIAGPWFDVGGVPTITVQVNLNDVPAGSACRVSIVRGNTVVKGSTSSYTVSA
jgi:hypothetical protein